MAAGRIKGITIEIGGNTTKLVTALSKVDNALSKTQTNLRDINKALKFDPGNAELLKDKQNELARAISETKEKLDAEKEAYAELAKQDKTPENIEKMRQLKTQIDLDTVALKELEAQAQQASSVLGTQMQVAGKKIEEVGEKIKGVGDKLSSIGSDLTMKVTAPIVGGFAAAVKTTGDFDAAMSKVQAVSGATASDVALLRDKAKEMGETTKFSASESAEALNYMAMAGWKTEDMLSGIEGVMNLAAASGEDLATTSDIVTDALTAFGYSAEDSGHFADILAAAASNANTNVSMMGESFKYAAPVAGALGYSAEDVAVALGLMANSGIKADQAGTSLRNMFNRMAKPTKESAEAMERLGIELYDDQGKMYSFRQIMEQLRGSMQQINMPLEKYNEELDNLDAALEDGTLSQKKYDAALEELNLQAFGAEGAEKARAAAMLGGTRAMSGLLAISNATEADYEKLTSAIDNSSQSFAKLADGSVVPLSEALQSGQEIIEQYSGSAEAMANTMLDNLPGQITLLKSQLEGLAISFGELLMPTVRKVVGVVQEFVDKLNSMDDAQREQIIKIAAVVAAIGPALLIIGKIVSGVGSIVAVVGKLTGLVGKVISSVGGLQGVITALTGPIGIVIAAVAALTAAFVYFYNTNEEFRNKVNAVIESVKEAFAGFIAQVQEWLPLILEWVAPIIEGLKSYLTALAELAMAVLGAMVTWIRDKISAIQQWMNEHQLFVQTTFSVIKTIIQAALTFIQTIFSSFYNILGSLTRAITAAIRGDWKSALDNLKNAVQTALSAVAKIFETLKGTLKSIFSDIISAMKQWGRDMIDNLVNGIKEKISKVKEAVGEVANTIREFLHFSEPDIGPLADFSTYAPDMMKLFAQGITQNAGLITDAIQKSFNLQPVISGAMRQNAMALQGGAVQPIEVNVVLEGTADRIFRVVNIEAGRNQQLTGNVFNK
ncbi:MAG: phage tail tape measure protein [Clostridiales bacterium]|nr:phage tail tape measure protein [Clostridiales bacterium]MBQ1572706.1 phage tail tape measure protein [Clostridiales bacterium]